MSFTPIATGDNLVGAVNNALGELDAQITQADGANLEDGSVPNSKLALGKATFCPAFTRVASLTTSNVSNLFSFRLPPVDGASSGNWRYLGMSVSANVLTTPLPAGARIDVKKNGVAIHQIPVDGGEVVTAGVPVTPTPQPLVAVACSSGDVISADFVAGASGDMSMVDMVPFFSQRHVGT
jgi:hypothetical protein